MKYLTRSAAFFAIGAGVTLAFALVAAARAESDRPIKIGVIAEAHAVADSSIPPAVQLATDEINAKGGIGGRKIEIVSYDDH
jgi:branched-chain amino acid transport system substrate-binding protein